MFAEIQKELAEWMDKFPGCIGLFLSGGADSLLLLNIMREVERPFSVITFDQSWTREQRKYLQQIIYENELRVFSYPPFNAYLVGDGNDRVSVVEEYRMIDGSLVPFVRDACHDERRCAVTDVMLGPFIPFTPVGFKLNIFGSRKGDRHYTIGGRLKTGKITEKQGFVYYNPLWDLTKKDVKAGLKYYGLKLPKIDTGAIPMCLNCLTGRSKVYCPKIDGQIAAHDWEPTRNLKLFREKYDV